MLKCILWFELVSHVSNVAHGPLVDYYKHDYINLWRIFPVGRLVKFPTSDDNEEWSVQSILWYTKSYTPLHVSKQSRNGEVLYRVHYNQSLMSHLSVKESRACQPQLLWYDSTTWHLVSSWGTIKIPPCSKSKENKDFIIIHTVLDISLWVKDSEWDIQQFSIYQFIDVSIQKLLLLVDLLI